MFKIRVFGIRFADEEAVAYAEKLARLNYRDRYDLLPESSDRRYDFDFYVTPTQRFFCRLYWFIRRPSLNTFIRFDEHGRHVGFDIVV
jgi:hypothetical protein